MATFATQLSQAQESTPAGDDTSGSTHMSTAKQRISSEAESIAFPPLNSDPFGNAASFEDPFTGQEQVSALHLFKDAPFTAFGDVPTSGTSSQQVGNRPQQSSVAINPFGDPDGCLNRDTVIHEDHLVLATGSKAIMGSDESDFSEIGQLCSNSDVISISTRKSSPTSIVANPATQQSPTQTSLASSFTDVSSGTAPSDCNASSLALSRSSSSAVLVSGNSSSERLLDGANCYESNTAFETDSGHSTETAAHTNMTETPPRLPNSVYRKFVDESLGDAGSNANMKGSLVPNQQEISERQQEHIVSALQVPQILLTEATILSSDGSSFEMLSSSHGGSEGLTHLLESTAADDESSINARQSCDKLPRVFVYNAINSDEETTEADPVDSCVRRDTETREDGARNEVHNANDTQLDVDHDPRAMIMNLSAINASDEDEGAPEFESPAVNQMPSSDRRRRSTAGEHFANPNSDLTDLGRLTNTYSVDDLNKELDSLSVVQKPKVFTSSPIAPRTKEAGSGQSMRPMQKWREEFRQKLAHLDSQEQENIESLRLEAKRCIDKWYANWQETIRLQHTVHLENEALLRALVVNDRKDAKSVWDRMTSLALELQRTHKADEVNKDVSRMKSLLLLLKTRPPLQRFEFACAAREAHD